MKENKSEGKKGHVQLRFRWVSSRDEDVFGSDMVRESCDVGKEDACSEVTRQRACRELDHWKNHWMLGNVGNLTQL